MFRSRRDREGSEADTHDAWVASALYDSETGLAGPRQLDEHLEREIARSRRHGDRSCLVIFDVQVVVPPGGPDGSSPSPAAFVAGVLLREARATDIVLRLDRARFLVFLAEADQEGATHFADRVRTAIASGPFARSASGAGIYARAWAGVAAWQPDMETPGEYLAAAVGALEATLPQYEAAQRVFGGRPGPGTPTDRGNGNMPVGRGGWPLRELNDP